MTGIARDLPEVIVEEHGAHLGFTIRGKPFAWYLEDHHGDGRLALTCRGGPGVNHALAETRPDRYFLPPYVASRGWVGLWLDVGEVDWEEVAELMLDSYRLIAPRRMVASLDQQLRDGR